MNVVFSLIMCCACVSTAVGSSGGNGSNFVDSCSDQGMGCSNVLGQKKNSDGHKQPLIDDVWKKEKPTYTVNEEGIHEIAFPEAIFSKYGNDVVSLRPIKIQIDSKVANWGRFREQTEQLKVAISNGALADVLRLVDAMCSSVSAKFVYNGGEDLLRTCKELDKLQEYLRLLSLRGAKDDLSKDFPLLSFSSAVACSEFVVFNNKAVLPEDLYIAGLYIRYISKNPEEYSSFDRCLKSNKNVIAEINRNGGINSSDSTSFLAWGIKKALEDKRTFDLLPEFLKKRLRPS